VKREKSSTKMSTYLALLIDGCIKGPIISLCVSIFVFGVGLKVFSEFSESCLGLGKTKTFLNESQ
jgi:hypothetical protein